VISGIAMACGCSGTTILGAVTCSFSLEQPVQQWAAPSASISKHVVIGFGRKRMELIVGELRSGLARVINNESGGRRHLEDGGWHPKRQPATSRVHDISQALVQHRADLP